MIYTQLLLMLVLMTMVVVGDYCPYQICSCSDIGMYCGYLSLKVLPQRLSKNDTIQRQLYLDGNFITSIPSGGLPGNLSIFSIQSNPTETIDDAAFDESIHTLQEVDLSAARFTQIPQAVFHLKSLTKLYIYNMNINQWNDTAMIQLSPTIQTIDFMNISITTWPTWIKSMYNLSSLMLNQNSISIIPDDGLDKLATTLTYLDLSYNLLTTLPKSMSNLTVLSTLYLSNNKLFDLRWLPQSQNLFNLDLSYNKITDAQKFSSAVRSCAYGLNYLEIYHNTLTSIPDLSLLTKTTSIDLSFNRISNANSGSFPSNTTYINLSNNMLPTIPSTIINLKMVTNLEISNNNIRIVQGNYLPTSLTSLDLTSNSISQITHSSFPANFSLTSLNLDNNPLSLISADAFDNIPSVTYLSISNTKMTRLPLAMVSLKNLTYLDFYNNTKLACTCQEQSLYSFITKLGQYGIWGDCGVTSVYSFFTELSPQCPH